MAPRVTWLMWNNSYHCQAWKCFFLKTAATLLHSFKAAAVGIHLGETLASPWPSPHGNPSQDLNSPFASPISRWAASTGTTKQTHRHRTWLFPQQRLGSVSPHPSPPSDGVLTPGLRGAPPRWGTARRFWRAFPRRQAPPEGAAAPRNAPRSGAGRGGGSPRLGDRRRRDGAGVGGRSWLTVCGCSGNTAGGGRRGGRFGLGEAGVLR